MKFFGRLISNIPFFTYSKKVDPMLTGFLRNGRLKYIPVILVCTEKPDQALESRIKRLGFKKEHTLGFINGISGKMPVKNFDHVLAMLEIEKIFYDGKAMLMGAAEEQAPGMQSPQEQALPVAPQPTAIGGKGVTAAFIDSGIYPHKDFCRPKNRIAAFKDFVNEYQFPYDDNGHGTACVGAAFGASMDGKFRALAYDAGIVCAKAFDKFGAGSYSDILAAMQWIMDSKDSHGIKVAVMPFGTVPAAPRFDILSLGVTALWKQNILVCTCTGNLGPMEGSMTSPGSCEASLTAGACKATGSGFQHAGFSGCGPVGIKADKPDIIMPGADVETLNADIEYIPVNSVNYSSTTQQTVLYRQFSGTSISASMAGAAAVLLYQKKPALTPDDAKNILKKCAVSINELKIAQGAGMIDIKKLEQL